MAGPSDKKFNPEDPPSGAGYWHGSANGPLNAMRAALEPFARLAVLFDYDGEGPPAPPDEMILIEAPSIGNITVAHIRVARAALLVGRPIPRKTLVEKGAKEIDPQRGLTHEKHDDKDKR
jgi:hypothetical protein